MKVLVTDDEPAILQTLKGILERQGYEVVTAPRIGEAQRILRRGDPPDVALVDLLLPDGDGTKVLDHVREHDLPTSVIMISGHGSIPSAVEAVKRGAFDFLEKPLDRERLLITVRNAARQSQLLSREKDAASSEFMTNSPKMQALLADAVKFAKSSAPLLIEGETGAGKEVMARWIHAKSPRAGEPFAAINCAALPESLAESELFGHARGAFTGAEASRRGKFHAANRGTLFLDEIGDLSTAIQAKLLRVLEDGSVEPVGSDSPVTVDVRVIAASHRDLKARSKEGLFREDLLYRIGGLPLKIPPLRERPEDIGLLATHFFNQARRRQRWELAPLPDELVRKLESHDWPGNIRELRWAIERATLLAGPDTPGPEHLPEPMRDPRATISRTRDEAIATAEAVAIRGALDGSKGNVTKAAKALGVSRSRLYERLGELGINPDSFR